jgi:hypothetical protein
MGGNTFQTESIFLYLSFSTIFIPILHILMAFLGMHSQFIPFETFSTALHLKVHFLAIFDLAFSVALIWNPVSKTSLAFDLIGLILRSQGYVLGTPIQGLLSAFKDIFLGL